MSHNVSVPSLHPLTVVAGLLALAPYLSAAFFSVQLHGAAQRLSWWARILCPALLSLPYLFVSAAAGTFHWGWFALYALLPVGIAVLLLLACPEEEMDARLWPRFVILAALGLAVDLRWFESAWPAHLAIFNKVLLLDAGIYGFTVLRPIAGAGFDLRLGGRDLKTGLREFLFYFPIALVLGLSLSFLHRHGFGPEPAILIAGRFAISWIFTFFFIAVPEELFFRGWLQNLLERRIGRRFALIVTAILFGLAHFNKRTVSFNWRYVLLAAIAGVFYGRAWRRDRRVGASAVTHATVDSVWSIWLR